MRFQDVDLQGDKGACQLPASHEKTFQARYEDAQARPRQHAARSQQAPTSVPGRRRWRGELAAGRSEEETRRPRATCSRWGRVAPGCASSAEAPRRRRPGATVFCGRDNPTRGAVSHPRRPRTGANGSPPSSRRTAQNRRRLSQNCGRRAPRGCPSDPLLGGHLGSISCQKKCVKKFHRVNLGETTLHVSQMPMDNDVQNPPSLLPATTPLL